MISSDNIVNNKTKFEEQLKKTTLSSFVDASYKIKEYLFLCADNLLSKSGNEFLFFDKLQDYFFPLIFEFLSKHHESIQLHRLYKPAVLSKIKQYSYWTSLSEMDKDEISKHLLISSCEENKGFFFDTRFLNCPGSIRQCEFYISYDITQMSSHRSIQLSESISLQDLCLCIITLITKYDPDKELPPKQLVPTLFSLCEEFIDNKKHKGAKQTMKLFFSFSIKTFIHRINSSPTANSYNKKWVRMSDLKVAVADLILNNYFSRSELKKLKDLPQEAQSIQFKNMFLERHKNMTKNDPTVTSRFIDSNLSCPIKSSELKNSSKHINEMINRICVLNKKEKGHIIKPYLAKTKRISGISTSDRNLLVNIAANRELSMNKYSVSQKQKNRDVIDIYIWSKYSGITISRIRKLFKAIYVHSPFANGNCTLTKKEHHDFYSGTENLLFFFFHKLQKTKPNTKGLNKFIDLLITEIGGSQGDLSLAYQNLDLLNEICNRPNVLESEFKSLKDIRVLIFFSIEDRNKVLSCVEQFNCPTADAEEIATCSLGNMLTSKMIKHCNNLRNKEPGQYKKKSISVPITRHVKGAVIDILPYDNPLGFIGAGVKGVCIPFGGHFHIEHYGDAFANLIIRDSERVLLWGLLVRVQNFDDEVYVLNNLQGALSPKLAKHKNEFVNELRETFKTLGKVATYPFFFNSINIIDENIDTTFPNELHLPNVRLDISSTLIESTQPYGKHYLTTDPNTLYLIN